MDRADYEREVQKRLDEGHSPLDTVRYIKVKYGLTLLEANGLVAPIWNERLRSKRRKVKNSN
jgi:hypothetical protein